MKNSIFNKTNNIVLLFLIFISNCNSQSIALKTDNNLIVISEKSNSDFEFAKAGLWNGKLIPNNKNFILSGHALISTSSDVGYLFGVIEVNYNNRASFYSDLIGERKFVRIFKLNKNSFDKNSGKLYMIVESTNLLKKPVENSVWSLKLKTPTQIEITETELKLDNAKKNKELLEKKKIQDEITKDSITKIENENFRKNKIDERYSKYENSNNSETIEIIKLLKEKIKTLPNEYFSCSLIVSVDENGNCVNTTQFGNESLFNKYSNQINDIVKTFKVKPFVGDNGKNYKSTLRFNLTLEREAKPKVKAKLPFGF